MPVSTKVGGTKAQPSIKLLADINPDGEADASLPIRWCVTPELTAQLANLGVTNPFLLISVRPYRVVEEGKGQTHNEYSSETRRYLVPLTQELQYVSFSRPGHNEINAIVVWNDEHKGRWHLGSVFNHTDAHGRYDVNVLSDRSVTVYSGHQSNQIGKTTYEAFVSSVHDSLSVVVPAEHFAKEPPAWLKTYLGKFNGNRPFDECSFRRRAIIGLAWMPFWFVLTYLFRIGQVVVGGLIGFRDIDLKPLVHPLSSGTFDVWDDVRKDQIFWLRKKKGYKKSQMYYLVLAWPVITLVIGTALWVIGAWHVTRGELIEPRLGWAWYQYFLAAAALQLALIAVISLGFVVVMGISLLTGTSYSTQLAAWWRARRERNKSQRKLDRERKQEEDRQRDMAELRKQLDAMVCRADGSAASVNALPPEKRTIKLRFQATKQKVCRPFAR